ncbi:MAG TPA: hypothetical protein VFH31_01180 [Pyrinomonadaceae bacterium]|nr:hypothetical protein [Pyrinomonadaceae bacterium]
MPGTVVNGARLLLFLRDEPGGWNDLCRRLDIHLTSPADTSNRMFLSEMLVGLHKAGLIEYNEQSPENSSEIKPTNQWNVVQTALGRPKLADIADISDYAKGIVATPVFGRPDKAGTSPRVFVLMPFNAELGPLYKQLKNLGEQLGVTIKRADEIYGYEGFIVKVWKAIFWADLIIADCTQRNPNVFYEIGLAHVLGKPVVFITRSNDDIPSDIRHLEYIEYKYDEKGVEDLLEKLGNRIKETLGLK